MVEFDVHNMQKIKTMVHITQMVFIVVAIVMQIVVYSKAQQISGRTGWYFGMVRCSSSSSPDGCVRANP